MKFKIILSFYLTVFFSFIACGDQSSKIEIDNNLDQSEAKSDDFEDKASEENSDQAKDIWQPLKKIIDNSSISDMTVLIGTAEGIKFNYSKGQSSDDKTMLIASASKLLATMTLMKLVEKGILSLEDNPQKYLSWWTKDLSDQRSAITLRQLMSFTAGFTGEINEIACVGDKNSKIDNCAKSIYENYFQNEPGKSFFYGPASLQVAGAMASSATNKSFHRLFRQEIGEPLALAKATGFLVPSLANPRVAGGATASGEDYAKILIALSSGKLLSEQSMNLLMKDYTGKGIKMLARPDATSENGNDWHYALGCWRECSISPYPESCDNPGVISSPGAFGFYPWWDRANGIWGVLALRLKADEGGASKTVPIGQSLSAEALKVLGLK